MKEFHKTPKKSLNYHSLYLTSNQNSKVFLPQLTQEKTKLNFWVTENNSLEMTNKLMKLNSPPELDNLDLLLKLLTSSSQDSEMLEVMVMKKKLSSNLPKSERAIQSTHLSKLLSH
jgi:hypothetical protein